MDESFTQRFGGIGRLYGAAALPRLAAAHVAVVGVGGVGSWVVEALARSGVGELTLIDMDDVCITNTNRQLPALAHTVGQAKVDVLVSRVAEINPDCRVHRVLEFLLESNVDRLLTPDFDFVVDAIDRTSIKALILAKCRARGLPVITSGSAGGRRDPTAVRMADLGQAGTDPLLRGTRQSLRKDHGFAVSSEGRPVEMGIPCVFSTEKPVFPWADGSCSLEPESGAETGLRLDCSAGFGAATFVTGAFGFALAAEVVRRLT
ncbi:MAG TPA: tRNA threonylcarbamoyladenosine dehydratase [Prosthecobacter sp.]